MRHLSLLFTALLCTPLLHAQSTAQELIDKGTALHDEGRYAEAIEQFNAALEADPDNRDAHAELANTYYVMQEFDKAIAESDKVIKGDDIAARQAYDVKGSALDALGKPKDAIKNYEAGIKKFPDSHLLHFNLALTLYNTKEPEKAEKELMAALRARETHASSHYLLGVCMMDKGARARAMLCLYNFLLLEPQGKRAKVAYAQLTDLMSQGVSRTGPNNIQVTLPMNAKEDDSFRAADMAVSLLQAAHMGGEDSTKTEKDHFIDQTTSFFKILGEMKGNDKKNSGFWWDFYVSFFYALARSEHLDTFCRLVSLNSLEDKGATWLNDHQDEVKALYQWCGEQERSFQ